MFQDIIETSIFVKILIFAIVSILSINVVTALANFILNIYMRIRKLQ
jgi:hypothetical protein